MIGLDELLEHGVVHGDQRDLRVTIRHAGDPTGDAEARTLDAVPRKTMVYRSAP